MSEERQEALAFDVYGTLVDPLEMNEYLRPLAGEQADRLAGLWREKQLEYTFRRGLMGRYEDFGVCTQQALEFAARALAVELTGEEKANLIEEYQNLRAFPDVAPGIERLRAAGYTCVAFSNGLAATARTLLQRAGVLQHLDGVVSVDPVRSFKPDPEVYRHLGRELDRPAGDLWLVSSNPFDVIGAKNVGLRAAWVKRRPEATFDPWEEELQPDIVVSELEELAREL